MIRTNAIAIVLFGALCGLAAAADAPKVIGTGDWSKVVDNSGCAIRARLVVGECPRGDKRRETSIYLEIQDATDSKGRDVQIYCDLSALNFRPGEKGGVTCELRDKDGESIKSLPSARSGGIPGSRWVTLPSDATIRLRISPYGIARESGIGLVTTANNWIIAEDDASEYFLSGVFTADPAENAAAPEQKTSIWSGTIKLPPVRIANPSK
jgi:hypothetical protein